jgi:hypothetical protein
MELIDQYYQPETIDCYTFVFDEVTPETGFHTMLAMSADGHTFSQWTSGTYDSNGDNAHLGTRINLHDLGHAVLDAFFARLSIPAEWEGIRAAIEQERREDK